MLANVTHFETPLDPTAAARRWSSKDGVRRTTSSGSSAPSSREIFRQCAVRDVWQSRSPADAMDRRPHDSSRSTRFDPASGRRTQRRDARGGWNCTTPGNSSTGRSFQPDHVYYIPLSCMVPARRRQHRRGRPLRGRGRERPVRHQSDGAVHRDGHGCRARARSGRDGIGPRDRQGGIAEALDGQPRSTSVERAPQSGS